MGWIQDAGKKISGSVKTGVDELVDFVKDPVEGFENAGAELRRWRDNVRNLSPAGVSEELWGEGGRFAYPAGAAIMSKRSPTGVPLAESYKEALRPYFGDVVDRVTIHWATPPLDEWAADKFSISLEDTDTQAQTFGHDIYIKDGEGEKPTEDELSLLAHELVHVLQYEKYGQSFSNFGYHYFKEYKKAGLDYSGNDMEEEAYRRQQEFERKHAEDSQRALVRSSGDLDWYRHDGWKDGTGRWAAERKAGQGWQAYRSVFAAGEGILYAMTSVGDLHWYRHDGWTDGTGRWTGEKQVGHGWQAYKSVFASSDGILYALAPNGDLFWYRHDGWKDGTGRWTGEKHVGHGWQDYGSVFATSQGILYAVAPGGELYWYRHDGWQDGTGRWTGGKQVGQGWHQYESVFASSEGVLYALTKEGELFWYKHAGWKDGAGSWSEGKQVGHGWQAYRLLFPSSNGVLYGIVP